MVLPCLDRYITSTYWFKAKLCMSVNAAHTPNGKQGGQSLLISIYQYRVSGHLLIANFNSHTFDQITLSGWFLCAINRWVPF